MNAEVFPRLIRAIHEQHLDGLLAVSPENVAYVVGFPVGGPGEARWRQAAALVTWDGRTALLCVDALSQSRIGTELDSLAAADFQVLAARFPNVTWAPSWGSR